MNTLRFVKFCAIAAAGLCLSFVFTNESSARERETQYNSTQERRYQQKNARQERRGSYFNDNGYTHLNIPARHYPRLGECRIWYPDRQRSSRIRCGQTPPRGAWLIQHPRNRPRHVYVNVYEPQSRGIVFSIGEFEIRSGAFLREMPHR
ncbi:MAG: hypothetical protein CDV28_1617 [Candidatus Electronema aureum]|uniref:Uncharacterized protein n=1 Tax=Candidatus Electronema aureum TaxID=2005002 RepID=A0A521FYE2_9BACT|nr:MAG: hypothetical protein CDV28_1617 [Candidatus Electronema aureum]